MADKETAGNTKISGGKPGPGRPRGTVNKATATVRNAISSFIEAKAAEVESLWTRVAEKDPGKALELYAKLAEFILPKLARTEIKEESHEQRQVHEIVFVPPPKRNKE
jgi:hypothetical protein